MVILPSATTSSVGAAALLVNELEGGALPAGAAAFPVAQGRDRGRRRSRTPPRVVLTERPRGEVCRNFNLNTGKCTGKGKCPDGRVHECAVCGAIHRGTHHHSQESLYSALGMSKGKGKKGGGKKGNKGDGKNKNKE